MLDIQLDFADLESRAKQIDQITSKLREVEAPPEEREKQDLGYIG